MMMTSSLLKKIRIIFSLLLIVFMALIFLDLRQIIPEGLISGITFLQFIPSAVKNIGAGAAASAGFIIVMILTAVAGRIYCSFLCPLGTLQDIFSRAGGKVRRRFRKFGYEKPFTVLRYTLLSLTLLITVMWGTYFLSVLDPYSIFGRTMTFFVRPVAVLVNNLLSSFLTDLDFYAIVHQPVVTFRPAAYVIPAAFLLLVGFLSFTRGRLFCNTVCPLGTMLGLISKISLFRIRFSESGCSRCGRCASACKSACIDFIRQEVDNSRCVNCFNCIESCQEKSISYSLVRIKGAASDRSAARDEGRREFIALMIFLAAGSGRRAYSQQKAVPVPVPKKKSTVKENRSFPVAPPGSAGIGNFTSRCTACSLCISACPNNVLKPSVREYGIASIMQPHLDYRKGFCAYECTRCLDICPTGAIMPMVTEAKKLSQIGKAVFIKENCIVQTEKTACGACAESCPTKAVHMIQFEGNLKIPETTDDICIGCGHCEFACPTVPYKAIYINGNPVHAAAKKPVNVQTEISKPTEFPF